MLIRVRACMCVVCCSAVELCTEMKLSTEKLSKDFTVLTADKMQIQSSIESVHLTLTFDACDFYFATVCTQQNRCRNTATNHAYTRYKVNSERLFYSILF